MGKRADQNGVHRLQFERNKKVILATQDVCGICGRPVDKSLKFPHPLSPVIDHIIPIAKGGHPSDLSNLQLAHRSSSKAEATLSNIVLPISTDWNKYKGK